MKSNIKKLINNIVRNVRTEMKIRSVMVPARISANCPNPRLKPYFQGEYIETKDGGGFKVLTDFPEPIAIYVEEFGRPGRKVSVIRSPGLGRGRPPQIIAGGIPIKLRHPKYPPKPTKKMGPKELAKWTSEQIIIRSQIKPYKGSGFIRKTWKDEYPKIVNNIIIKIKGAIRSSEL